MDCRPAPIALFVYNRPWHVRETVRSLSRNELASESDLYVFSDGARDPVSAASVDEVRRYVRSIDGFRSVVLKERSVNAGLARSIIEGVTAVIGERGRVIVLEDDMVTSRGFLRFMNQALSLYQQEERVASIHGYCYPVAERLPETFFLRGADCWGWATWDRAWHSFEPDGRKLLAALRERRLVPLLDMDGAFGFSDMLTDCIAGRNDSWAIRWHVSCFLEERLTLYPGRSLVRNIGNDASGTHSVASLEYCSELTEQPVRVERIEVAESAQARNAFAGFLRNAHGGRVRRALSRIRRVARGRR